MSRLQEDGEDFPALTLIKITLQLLIIAIKTNQWWECTDANGSFWGRSGGSHYQCWTQPATMTAFISVELWEACGNSSVVLNCMQDTIPLPDPPPPLILSATLNGKHHMVKQQASHDNKGKIPNGHPRAKLQICKLIETNNDNG